MIESFSMLFSLMGKDIDIDVNVSSPVPKGATKPQPTLHHVSQCILLSPPVSLSGADERAF